MVINLSAPLVKEGPLAGGCPVASYFLLLRQKKVTKEKATLPSPETSEVYQRLAAVAA